MLEGLGDADARALLASVVPGRLDKQTTYAAPAIRVRQRVQRANVNLGTALRAPVEGCGLWALGSAINELAARLQIDPIELRLANYSDVHPSTGSRVIEEVARMLRTGGARVRMAPAP